MKLLIDLNVNSPDPRARQVDMGQAGVLGASGPQEARGHQGHRGLQDSQGFQWVGTIC